MRDKDKVGGLKRLAADAAPANEGQGQGRGALNVWLQTLHQPMRAKDKVGALNVWLQTLHQPMRGKDKVGGA